MVYSGKVLATVLKEKKISVTRLAKLMNVSRGTIYYWFKQDDLSAVTINEIGYIIKYDFSIHQKNRYFNNFTKPVTGHKEIKPETDILYTENFHFLLSKLLKAFVDDDHILNQFQIKQLKDKVEPFLNNERTMIGL